MNAVSPTAGARLFRPATNAIRDTPDTATTMQMDLFEFLGMSCGRRQSDASELGLVVWSVELGSAAERAGLQAGDVILEVDHRALAMSDEALEGARAARKRNVLLRVWTRGKSRYFLVNSDGHGQ